MALKSQSVLTVIVLGHVPDVVRKYHHPCLEYKSGRKIPRYSQHQERHLQQPHSPWVLS